MFCFLRCKNIQVIFEMTRFMRGISAELIELRLFYQMFIL